jgi:hypothetical protein
VSKVIEKNGPYKIKQTDAGKFELYGWEGELLDDFETLGKARMEMQQLIYIDVCAGDLDYE